MSDPLQVPDRLNGWKEIAAFLGKSVRSAQRWESELGLPVERFTGPDGGQIVQASRQELDDWRRARVQSGAGFAALTAETAGTATAGAEDETSALVKVPPEPAGTASGRQSIVRGLSYAGVLVAGVAAGIALTLASIPVLLPMARFEVHGTAVQALTDDGRPVWSHDLGRIASRPVYAPTIGGRLGDLDGDGELEAAVPVSYTVPWAVTHDTSDEVHVFSRRGELRTVVRPDVRVDHRGRRLDGPWLFKASVFSSVSAGRLWTAYTAVTGGPSFVLETDAAGVSRVRFLVDGDIFALAVWQVGGRERLAVGGHESAERLAFVAMIPLDGEGTRWPHAPGGPSCDGCGEGGPEAIALLPRTELMEPLLRPNSLVFRMRPERDRLVVETEAGPRPAAMFWLDADLQALSHRWLPRYQATHRELETEGRLDHSLDECPERRRPLAIRRWRPASGWSDLWVTSDTALPVVPEAS